MVKRRSSWKRKGCKTNTCGSASTEVRLRGDLTEKRTDAVNEKVWKVSQVMTPTQAKAAEVAGVYIFTVVLDYFGQQNECEYGAQSIERKTDEFIK